MKTQTLLSRLRIEFAEIPGVVAWLPALLAFLLIATPAAVPAEAQTTDEIRQQAQSQLEQMTPEEIDQKLQQLGITRAEAIQRARDYGISLDEYLSRAQTAGARGQEQPASPEFLSDPRLQLRRATSTRLTRADSLALGLVLQKARKVTEVPGFKGRRGIDSTIHPFGYAIFQYPPSAVLPTPGVSAPPSYALGPGDEVTISVWGETRLNYQLSVNREGNVVVPDVGPVSANGVTLEQFRQNLLRRMSSIYSSLRGGASARTFLDVSLGKLKTIQVFVLGEVAKPGAYALPSMSTALTALYAAGGPTADGSLREVKVVRSGDSLPPADLYDYMLKGERSNDRVLQDGDVVFLKPAGKRAAVVGDVIRPAIYELKEGESLGDLIGLSGGLRFDAYFRRVHIDRIVPFGERTVRSKDILDLDLDFATLDQLRRSRDTVQDGDIVTVFRIDTLAANRVVIEGNVAKPGPFELQTGMRVRDLILAADSLRRNTFAERGLLFRLLPNLKREILSYNPRLALEGDEKENLLLKNEDSLVLFKETAFFPEDSVTITGAVRRPGIYPRGERMTVADLALMAGGRREDALTSGWEISRMDTTELGVYSRVLRVNLPAEYWNGGDSGKTYLKAYDVVSVPVDPKYIRQKLVHIEGYVMYPGTYAIRYEGERLAEIFGRAGGLRQGAYLEASRLIRRFNNAGLVPIDFVNALDDTTSRDNVVMHDGDSVYVAFKEDVVYVSGEVIVPSPVLYKHGASLGYYIDQAGGYKDDADEGRTVVLLPGGKKWNSSWFIFPNPEILAGSSIFVPKKVEKEDKTLPLIRDLATILASMAALTVAVVQVTK